MVNRIIKNWIHVFTQWLYGDEDITSDIKRNYSWYVKNKYY